MLTQRKSVSNAKNFLNNYGSDLLFKSFVYPYFNKETLNRIGSNFLWEIYDYLHNCCEELQSIIARQNLAYYEKRFSWNAVPGDDNKALLHLLNKTLQLSVSIDNTDIIKSSDDEFVTVLNRDDRSMATLQLDSKHKRVLAKDDRINGQRCEYDILQINSNLDVCVRIMPQNSMTDLTKRTKMHLEFLVYRIICSLESLTDEGQKSIVSILQTDLKFLELIYTLQDKFLNGLNMFKQTQG
ncbi:MAG: hypothetical protein ACRD8Z_22065 [Nitrososphaeraceae archaeon]